MAVRKMKKSARRAKDLPVTKLGAGKARQITGGAVAKSTVVSEKIGPDRS